MRKSIEKHEIEIDEKIQRLNAELEISQNLNQFNIKKYQKRIDDLNLNIQKK